MSKDSENGEKQNEHPNARGFENIAKSEPYEIQELVKEKLPSLSKHQIEALSSVIHSYFKDKYKKAKIPKYGHLNKGFDDYQLQSFFRVVKNEKYRLLFSYMATLGFRIGEVVRININSIDFNTRELKLRSEKSARLDSLIVPIQLFRETIDFIRANKEAIGKAQGYLFFRDETFSKRELPYLEQNYIRKVFREYVDIAGLNDVYDESDESGSGRRSRKLHLLTTHSLRHYAITKFARQTNGNVVLASKFARHSDPSTTMRYIHSDKRELYQAIDEINTNDIEGMKKRLK